MRQRWFSARALLLHAALVITVPLFLAAAWWQIKRAGSGNLLSYGYAVEWPLFAVAACYFWWQLIHLEPGGGLWGRPEGDHEAGDDAAPTDPAGTTAQGLERDREHESPELRAYNDGLTALATTGRRKTWRNPRGAP